MGLKRSHVWTGPADSGPPLDSNQDSRPAARRVLLLNCCRFRCLAVAGLLAIVAGLGSPAELMAQGGGNGIQLVQSRSQRVTAKDSKPQAPLPYEISKMPDVQEDMEIIHRRSQLIVARNPVSRIAIADPNIIDVVQYSPNEFSVIGLVMGTTTLTLWFDNSREPLIYLVEVIPDPTWEDRLRTDFGKLEKQLRILFPNSKVYLIPLQQRLIVKGQARDNEDAARILQIVRSAYFMEFGAYGAFGAGGYGGGYGGGGYGGGGGRGNDDNDGDDDDDDDFIVNLLEVPGNHQIMLHVKIAEISRGQLREFSLGLSGQLNDGRHTITSNVTNAAIAAGAGISPAAGLLTGVFENGELGVTLNWLAGNRTSRILAAPTLTVLSGHTATFLAGGEFPVPTIVGVGGAQGQTTSFRGFGTSLLVRPEVIDKDWIKMDITPEYSQINQANGAGGVPGLNSRRVSTTVQLREGQTIVLAGLFGSTMSQEINRIPYLGELPIIGPILFNAKTSDQGANELLIMVTPELVRPMEPDEVPPLPGFYMTPPNDIELYQYAKSEGYPDQGVYQLSPYGWGPGYAEEISYRPFNPASYGSPAPLATGGFQMPMGGMNYPQQPSAVYPGPPMPQAGAGMPGSVAPGYGQPPAGAAPGYGTPPAGLFPQQAPTAIQPTPDPAMNGAPPVQQMGAIQQVGYEEPRTGGGMIGWMRGRGNSVPQQNTNPAMLSTNATSPSLENGIDGRLNGNGRTGQRRPAARRGLYQ